MIFTEVKQIKEWIIANSEFFLKHEQKFSFIDVTHLPQRADDLIKNIIFCETAKELKANLFSNLKYFCIIINSNTVRVIYNDFLFDEEFIVENSRIETLDFNTYFQIHYSYLEIAKAYKELMALLGKLS